MSEALQIMHPTPRNQTFKWLFHIWFQVEFDLMIHTRHHDLHLGTFTSADVARLIIWVRAVAGAFNLGQFAFRVVAQVLHDLIARGHKRMASWLYSATLTTVMVSGRRKGQAVMRQVCSALQ